MSKIQESNDGYRYLLTVIDCFSKFAWVIPLRKKDSKTSTVAFHALLTQVAHPRKPQTLQTDKGKEFLNKEFLEMLAKNGIHHFSTNNVDVKAAMAERFNRTIKAKLYRYFTHKNTTRYIEVLPKLLEGYNNSYHRSIGMAPSEVNELNSCDVYDKLFFSKDLMISRKRFKTHSGILY
jgi:transposase InsO family protein